MTPEYKAEKEASVSWLGGGGMWEINHVALVAPAAAFLWAMLQSRQLFFKPYTSAAAFTDFLIQCCAILFATTVYSGAPQILNGLLILPALAAYLQPSTEAQKAAQKTAQTSKKPGVDSADTHKDEKDDLDPLPVKPFVTMYRGAMMIVTCACILAVDFPAVFPRRFAKTESFGTSLMDMGVGSFVFAAGVISARPQLKENHAGSRSLFSRLTTAMRHSLPLFVLGIGRLLSVKSLDYAEHVSEYGVHWNFFFTLALLGPAVAFLEPLLRLFRSCGFFAFVLAIGYELILFMVPDMKRYIILSERIPGDLLSQNREGVFSFLGYLAIFIAGMGIGLNILPRDPEPEDPRLAFLNRDPLDEDAEWLASVIGGSAEDAQKKEAAPVPIPQLKPELPKTALPRLAMWTGMWFIFAGWAMWKYGPRLFVSRRMANLAYVCWVCSFNTAQLLLFALIERVFFPYLYEAKTKTEERRRVQEATSRVMHAFNRNGLALFLLANLLTGAVNMTMPTLHMSDVSSMTVLVAYMATLCSVALALDHYNISIKL
ncbi:hypothetical protein DOTSEDRAFT_51693 [Dothistroma septosporum NZE10]|uniref:GPI-anchored wall transfer protein n=1 Tax=Dothistroma septosporum (strain NZE10 / CBS 128990) TaxID=675120 RepID=N1PRQ8_DOTSN|nr:hypothetical protein DOTSEDRAFT_51693 [Dothistroma septosporum NZE10]